MMLLLALVAKSTGNHGGGHIHGQFDVPIRLAVLGTGEQLRRGQHLLEWHLGHLGRRLGLHWLRVLWLVHGRLCSTGCGEWFGHGGGRHSSWTTSVGPMMIKGLIVLATALAECADKHIPPIGDGCHA